MSTTMAARRYPMGPRPGPRPDPGLRRLGPALSGRRLPMAAIFYSALGHILFFGGIMAFVMWSGWRPEKVQVVNLVPMVAAVGVPNAPVAPVAAKLPPSQLDSVARALALGDTTPLAPLSPEARAGVIAIATSTAAMPAMAR